MRAVTVVALVVSAAGALFTGAIRLPHPQSPEAQTSQQQTLVPRGGEKPSFDCAQAKTAAA